MLLALEALPDPQPRMERPLAHEAEVALFKAYQELRESIVLKGAQQIAVDCGLRAGRPSGRDGFRRQHGSFVGCRERRSACQCSRGTLRAGAACGASAPIGRYVITASTGSRGACVERRNRQAVSDFEHGEVVRGAAFNHDGSRAVTVSDDHTACIWEVQTGRQLVVLRGHSGSGSCRGLQPRRRSAS